MLIFVTEVWVKRRKTLQILYRAKGIMEFGSVYNGVAWNIIESVPALAGKCGPRYYSFESAATIIADRIDLERRKRLLAFFLCVGLVGLWIGWRAKSLI